MRNVFGPLLMLGLLTSCGVKSISNKEQVRSDLMQYLSTKAGLDLKALDVDVTNLQFSGDTAHATVAFHQKNDASIGSGMVMNYTLQAEKDHWVVKGHGDSQGHGDTPGHAAPGGSDSTLPPGHPPVSEQPVAPDPHRAAPREQVK